MAWDVYLGCVKNEHLVLQEPDMRVDGRDLSHLGVMRLLRTGLTHCSQM